MATTTSEFVYDPSTPEFQEQIWDVYRTLRDEHPVWRHPRAELMRTPGGLEFRFNKGAAFAGDDAHADAGVVQLPHQRRDAAEDLRMAESFMGLPNGPIAGLSGMVMDNFQTRNDFYGGQLGTAVEFHRNRLSLELSC